MAVRRRANTDRACGWLLTTAGMGSVKQGSGVGTAVADVCAWPLCQVLKFTKLVQIQSSEFEFKFKLIQTLTGPNRTFLSLKNVKQNMVVKVLKKGTTLLIETSSDSNRISNENSEKFLGLEFNRIY
jgi:hypothetical protein